MLQWKLVYKCGTFDTMTSRIKGETLSAAYSKWYATNIAAIRHDLQILSVTRC